MKRVVLLFLLFVFALPMFAQTAPEPQADQPKVAAPAPTPAVTPAPAPEAKPAVNCEKNHNFFVNKINTPIFIVQAAGAFWQAREVNGNASEFTTPSMWHRYLPNAYREAFAEMGVGLGVAYGFHKAHFKHHKLYERITLGVTAGALYITANRYLKAYNIQDCREGLTQFCH